MEQCLQTGDTHMYSPLAPDLISDICVLQGSHLLPFLSFNTFNIGILGCL